MTINYWQNIVAVSKKDPSGKILTAATYRYNVVGELLSAKDRAENTVQVSYDLAGRRTQLTSPDSQLHGVWKSYGRLSTTYTQKLLDAKESITYTYDSLNRLISTNYPEGNVKTSTE